MPQPPDVIQFLGRLRDLHGLLEHHGNYRGTFEGALLEAQGMALIAADGGAFDHGASMEQLANGLNRHLNALELILERFRTRDISAGTLLTNAVGPFLALCRRRRELVQQTQWLIVRIHLSAVDRTRLAGCPVRTRQRGTGGTVAQWLNGVIARTGWAPPPYMGNDILSTTLMADAAAQAVLAQIDQMPATAEQAAEETRDAAARSRQLIAYYAPDHRDESEEFSGYASALKRLWTPHGTLAE